MNNKTLGYTLSITGILNMILISSDRIVITFLTLLIAFIYGIFLLSKEDTPVKTLFDKLRTYKNNKSQSYDSASKETGIMESSNQKINYIAIVSSGLVVISIFLPWLEVSSSFSGLGQSFGSSGSISGISISGGMFGVLVSLAGGFMAFKHIKWAFIAGVVNFLNGLGYMIGWFGVGGFSYSGSAGGVSAKGSIDPQIGLYLFVFSSLIFVIFTLKNLKKRK
jgi:hypothetical protein